MKHQKTHIGYDHLKTTPLNKNVLQKYLCKNESSRLCLYSQHSKQNCLIVKLHFIAKAKALK